MCGWVAAPGGWVSLVFDSRLNKQVEVDVVVSDPVGQDCGLALLAAMAFLSHGGGGLSPSMAGSHLAGGGVGLGVCFQDWIIIKLTTEHHIQAVDGHNLILATGAANELH